MVTPGTMSGKPARNAATRAMFMPCSASGIAQPRITSSISSFGTCGYFSSSARMTAAAMSSGRVLRNVPRGAFPTAVRRQSTMTASAMDRFLLILVAQRLAGLEHVLHAGLRARDLRTRLRNASRSRSSRYCSLTRLFARQTSAAQHVRQLLGDHFVVVA